MTITRVPASPRMEAGATIYNRVFWLSYVANVALVTANALTFRFAELVAHLGGTEHLAGEIVSAGVFAALAARFVLGQTIDRYGTRTLWLAAAMLFTTGCLMFLLCDSLSWPIYAARIAFAVGLAGMMTCSIVHIQNQVPASRRTEVIASQGSSGFVGMIAGTQLGDAIFRSIPAGEARFQVLFGGAAALGVLYLLLAFTLTRGDEHERPAETPAAHRLLLRHWPGTVVLAAMMMGVGFTVYTVFLTRFATERNLGGIGTFFAGYATSAFLFRVWCRNWSRTIGRHRMVLMGLGGHFLANALLPFVSQEWHFLIPALAGGFGHALLFPAVVSLGCGAFPVEYRGTGTTIVLGFTEVGAMTSAPILGWIIDHFGFAPMFYTAAIVSASIAVCYVLTAARRPDDDLLLAAGLSTEGAETADGDEQEPCPFPRLGRSA